MRLLSRKDAKEKGLKFYFTGTECKNNHLSIRYTSVATCKACKEENRKSYYLKNKDEILKKDKIYRKYKKKPDSLYRKSCLKHYSRKRYCLKIKAVPKWADLNAIKEIYLNCPEGYEVDHIIPLQGKGVCGLHVENNLQYLTREENRKKSNSY